MSHSPYLSAFSAHFQVQNLAELDQKFLTYLNDHDPLLNLSLIAYRHAPESLTALQISELLLAIAPVLESFIAEIFGIQTELQSAQAARHAELPILEFKKWFVQRRARRRLTQAETFESFAELDSWLSSQLEKAESDRELAVANLGKRYLATAANYPEQIEKLTRWCVRALTASEGKLAVKQWISFKLPQQTQHENLVPVRWLPELQRFEGAHAVPHQREGFKLTDPRMNTREVLSEAHYCIYCHDHEGDYCSKGFPEKAGVSRLKTDPLGVTLTGCPLDEKISEMNSLSRQGYIIAPLAMVMVDNPMCPVTGHRICNDCMKACIYQKQDPVNIPQIETHSLSSVLQLPWGVEIYDLLVRWNPLRCKQWLPKAYNGLKVLIAGQGPAGFTLAHHLLMEGFAVVGIEGLKIEPLPEALLTQPIRDYQQLTEELDARVMAGFGGVAEYGITVRWDKNFLKLIYLSLARRPYFQVFGAVRFGGTITVESAWELGFDHLAIAVGAGLPQALPIPHSLAVGMRQANDFLMALQLTGAAKAHSLTNLQVRLPAVVIGGGLTGIDTATEVQAYYLVQIEKILQRHELLVAALGERQIRESLDAPSLEILDEYLSHAQQLRAERARAASLGEPPNVQALLRSWGGVTVAYRRSLQESPAYTRNHEEVIKAFEEGILYAPGLEPVAVRVDKYQHVQALVCVQRTKEAAGSVQENEVVLPARAIFVATGAQPNVAYEFEHRGHFQRVTNQIFQYQPHQQVDGELHAVTPAEHCKDVTFGAFTSYQQQDKRVSFIGDTHPVFHGSVVKAIASGMRTYPHIVNLFPNPAQGDVQEYAAFRAKMQDLLSARVLSVQRHRPNLVEISVRAPLAAKQYQAGQFFRVQNFETAAPVLGNTRLQTEAMAMLGAKVDAEAGTIKFLVSEYGASSRLFATLKVGDPLSVMGPTGAKTPIPKNETVMIIGERLGAIEMLSLAPVLKAAGNRVLYVACLQTADELFSQTALESCSDAILWVTASGEKIMPQRPQDCSYSGDLETALSLYARGELSQGLPAIALETVNRVLIMGSTQLMREVQQARHSELKMHFSENTQFTASVHSTMQCMLKGVCAQCLQWQIDPVTKQRTKAVFACSWQAQPIDIIDIDNLDERLSQNHLQERLANLWLDYLFAEYEVARV